MRSNYAKNLISNVVEQSVADTWRQAVHEWEIVDCDEDTLVESACICGKENLRYLYHIENQQNGNRLFPIGSSCIEKFDRKDLIDFTNVNESMFKLLRAMKTGKFIELNSELFTRKLLLYLFENRVFDNDFNGLDGRNDYEFMLKMFNKRNKDDISYAQKRKIRAIIMNSIRPYLERRLAGKI